jgi:hypothetical protein
MVMSSVRSVNWEWLPVPCLDPRRRSRLDGAGHYAKNHAGGWLQYFHLARFAGRQAELGSLATAIASGRLLQATRPFGGASSAYRSL